MDGTLTTEAAKAGITSIGCEVAGRAGLAAADVRRYVRGLTNVLRNVGMLDGEPARPDAAPVVETTTVYSPTTGIASSLPRLRRRVSRGHRLLEVVDPHGFPVASVDAPHSGELWAVRTCPYIREGEIVCLIAAS